MDESSKQLDYDYADILRQLQSGPNPVAVPMTTNSASELDSSSIFNTQDLGLSSAPSKRHLGITSQVNEIILEANQESSLNREPTLTNHPDLPNMKIITGTAHPELAQEIADHLGIKLTDATVSAFPDGETLVKINENSLLKFFL